MFKNFSKATPEGKPKLVAVGGTETAAAEAPKSIEPVYSRSERELMAFLELKSRMHDALLDRLNYAVIDKIVPDDLRREVASLVSEILRDENKPLRTDEFQKLVDELMDEILGLGPLEPLLADPSVNDIMVNGHDMVFVERKGLLEKTPIRFRDERHLLRIIDKIVSRVGRRVDESTPWVDARLEDGSRFNAIIRPCAIDGPSISIRKFAKMPYTMERLVDAGAMTNAASNLLSGLVKARLNILISGGTGSGKTTMLNAMSAGISNRERIVTIEDAAELQMQQTHVVRLETKPPHPSGGGAVTQRELVRNALRMRPDRIIVGEVRGAETFDMLQAMNTGHDGSMTTVHANSARDALGRLEQMVTMMGIDMPLSATRAQIASGLHFVVQLARLSDGRRRVVSVSEITGIESDVIMLQDIFVFRRTGVDDEGNVLGHFTPTGIRPRCAEHLMAAGVDIGTDSFQVRQEQ